MFSNLNEGRENESFGFSDVKIEYTGEAPAQLVFNKKVQSLGDEWLRDMHGVCGCRGPDPERQENMMVIRCEYPTSSVVTREVQATCDCQYETWAWQTAVAVLVWLFG